MFTLRRFYSTTIQSKATTFVQNILNNSVRFNPTKNKLFVLHDNQCGLSRLLTSAYENSVDKNALTVMNFDEHEPAQIKDHINTHLSEEDLVVCIQTGAFYLNDYRLRLELFNRNMKNIEHVHLGLMPTEQYETYVNSLAFDPLKNGPSLAMKLKQKIDNAKSIIVTSGKPGNTTQLHYETEMESALLNIGDYTGMKNVGGTFPVGEVFSEPKNLQHVNGHVMVFGFPNLNRVVEIHDEPFMLTIERGTVTKISETAPHSFIEVFNVIKENEGEVIIREFGVGINDGMGKYNPLNDVTAFERQKGLHLSLGKKHTVFKKENLKSKKTKFHIDVFIDVRTIEMDGDIIFNENEFF
jgi:hypothetical protein